MLVGVVGHWKVENYIKEGGVGGERVPHLCITKVTSKFALA